MHRYMCDVLMLHLWVSNFYIKEGSFIYFKRYEEDVSFSFRRKIGSIDPSRLLVWGNINPGRIYKSIDPIKIYGSIDPGKTLSLREYWSQINIYLSRFVLKRHLIWLDFESKLEYMNILPSREGHMSEIIFEIYGIIDPSHNTISH